MKRLVLVNGRKVEVDLDDPEVSVIEVESGIYSVLLRGRSFEAHVMDGGVEIAGRRYATEMVDPRSQPRTKSTTEAGAQQSLRAPMPGKIVRILTAVGDCVTAGQGILVMEAMKMQNEMKAPRNGVVASLHVAEGGAVSSGDLLAVIE